MYVSAKERKDPCKHGPTGEVTVNPATNGGFVIVCKSANRSTRGGLATLANRWGGWFSSAGAGKRLHWAARQRWVTNVNVAVALAFPNTLQARKLKGTKELDRTRLEDTMMRKSAVEVHSSSFKERNAELVVVGLEVRIGRGLLHVERCSSLPFLERVQPDAASNDLPDSINMTMRGLGHVQHLHLVERGVLVDAHILVRCVVDLLDERGIDEGSTIGTTVGVSSNTTEVVVRSGALESRIGVNAEVNVGEELGDVEAGDVTIVCYDDAWEDEGSDGGNSDGKLHAGRAKR